MSRQNMNILPTTMGSRCVDFMPTMDDMPENLSWKQWQMQARQSPIAASENIIKTEFQKRALNIWCWRHWPCYFMPSGIVQKPSRLRFWLKTLNQQGRATTVSIWMTTVFPPRNISLGSKPILISSLSTLGVARPTFWTQKYRTALGDS